MLKEIQGGVCAAKGFTANGVHCGIRKNKTKRDLALIVSETQAREAAEAAARAAELEAAGETSAEAETAEVEAETEEAVEETAAETADAE